MFRKGQNLGKYRIDRKIAEGGFAAVFAATDSIEGTRVALKIPLARWMTDETLAAFQRETKLLSNLEHPNILRLKNADFIDGHFVMTFPLGQQSLADRLKHRISASLAMNFLEQITQGVGYAHERNVIHCDIKPDNLILLTRERVALSDFGISKIARQTVRGSGSGTVGFVAPEQAMGKPSARSDVFSIGLIAYRLFAGAWPEWPFDWPPANYHRLTSLVSPDFIAFLKRAIDVSPRKRFRDGKRMSEALRRVKPRAILKDSLRGNPANKNENRDWRTVRFRQFKVRFAKELWVHGTCNECHGPISEAMQCCPWCASVHLPNPDESDYPQVCPSCCRGLKLDWSFCPWCNEGGFVVDTKRTYTDRRYSTKCQSATCTRKWLMQFMRYCPWCRTRVKRKWRIKNVNASCRSCGWGILPEFWSYCPWCEVRI